MRTLPSGVISELVDWRQSQHTENDGNSLDDGKIFLLKEFHIPCNCDYCYLKVTEISNFENLFPLLLDSLRLEFHPRLLVDP